jgi:superfamily II RNA helicase
MKATLASLTVAVVAGVIVLAVEYNVFQTKPSTAATSVPEQSKSSPVLANEATLNNAEPGSQAQLETLHKTAKQINSYIERDKELSKLVTYALDQKQYDYASDIARDINSYIERDRVLGVIVERANVARQFASANRAAKLVNSYITRDSLMKTILAAATTPTIQGSNPPLQRDAPQAARP